MQVASNDALGAKDKEIYQLKLDIHEQAQEFEAYQQQCEDNNEYIESLEGRCEFYLQQ